jgi:hypothetical protein
MSLYSYPDENNNEAMPVSFIVKELRSMMETVLSLKEKQGF